MAHTMKSAAFAITAAAMLAATPPLAADESFEPIDGVEVIDATATPTTKGGSSRLEFRLENLSSADVTLIGVTSPLAASGAMMIKTVDGAAGQADQYVIPMEETLDFGTSHIWLELRSLKSALAAGATAPFELRFRRGNARGSAHVHQ